MFPDFDRDSVLEKKVFRFKDAQHIVDLGYEDKIPEYQTPCPEVYLCNFSQIYPMDRGTNGYYGDHAKTFSIGTINNEKQK